MNLTPEQEALGRRNFLKVLAGTPAIAALGARNVIGIDASFTPAQTKAQVLDIARNTAELVELGKEIVADAVATVRPVIDAFTLVLWRALGTRTRNPGDLDRLKRAVQRSFGRHRSR